jgi:hypothetical protein
MAIDRNIYQWKNAKLNAPWGRKIAAVFSDIDEAEK